LDAEDVVVGREHVHGLSISRLHRDRNLRVIDAREVAGTGGLMFFGLQRERIRVHTGAGVAGVVVVSLHLVEVLTFLLLEAILTVKDKLELGEGTREFLGVSHGRGTGGVEGGTDRGDRHEAVGQVGRVESVGLENDISGHVRGGEVPQFRTSGSVGEAPHKLLNGVVVGEADLHGAGGLDGVGTSVLHLFDQVFMTLLGESASLFGVQVDVVGPHLESVLVQVGGEGGRDVDVDAHFMVLKGDQRQVQSGVPVEEEDEGKVDGAGGSSGHLSPGSLLGFVQVKLRVQTPPFLVVLVDALTTDGKLNVVDRTLGDPVAVIGGVHGGGVGGERLQFEVHITDKVTVTGNSHGDATGVSGSTVDGLLDVLHREVGVTLVFRLVEGNFGVTGKVDVLSAVGYELHETASHCECLYSIRRK
jgi:hypothetical protein